MLNEIEKIKKAINEQGDGQPLFFVKLTDLKFLDETTSASSCGITNMIVLFD